MRSGERRQPTPQEQAPHPQPTPPQESTSRPEPAKEEPQSTPTPASGNAAPTGGLSLESLRNRWGQVRADVSAVNVRIGALMSEMDPAALEGTKVILTVPYPFHAGKMNSDDTRPIVEDVLSRVMDTPLSLECFTVDEFRTRTPRTTAPVQPKPEPEKPAPVENGEPEIDASESLRALRNIFDAEEIDPEE